MNVTSKQNKSKLSRKTLIKFLCFSGIGIGLFMFPIYEDGNITNGMSIISDLIENSISSFSEYIVYIITCISAFGSLYALLLKPKFIYKNAMLKKLFVVSPIYLITKIIAFFICTFVVFKVGPELIYSQDIGGGMIDLSKTLVSIAITLSFMLPLLTDCGAMEFFGILLRDYVRTVFKVPGRACVDMITSWLGSSNTAVLVTRQQYEAGYYSKREAASIMTNFSLVSIPFCMVVASALDLNHIFPIFYLCITLIGIFLAVIGVRIPPLSSIKDTYLKEDINGSEAENIPEGEGKLSYAIAMGCKRAEEFRFKDMIKGGIGNALDIMIDLIPIVISWGTIGLIIANKTTIMQIISYPMGVFLNLFNVADAFVVAPATLVGFIDMFIPALIVGNSVAVKTRFIIGVLSLIQIIYLTEVGSIIMKSGVDLNMKKLFIIFLERTIIALPIIILLSNIIPM